LTQLDVLGKALNLFEEATDSIKDKEALDVEYVGITNGSLKHALSSAASFDNLYEV
jgi:hypothetical protein